MYSMMLITILMNWIMLIYYRTIEQLGAGTEAEAYQWVKVEKKTQEGKRYDATEKKKLSISGKELANMFTRNIISFKEHYHKWQFQVHV